MTRRRTLGWFLTGLFAAVVFFVLALKIDTFVGAEAPRALDIAVSGVLSLGLVLLYFRQTRILESQRELRTDEINREMRQQHTETLRERVRLWHGEPDVDIESAEIPDIDGVNRDTNTPTVLGASIESAPDGVQMAFPREEEFYVIPAQLQNDRYLTDLLENHAPDLKATKEQIESLYTDFQRVKIEFDRAFEPTDSQSTSKFNLNPTDAYSTWVLERLVLLERGRHDDLDELLERVESGMQDASSSLHPDEPIRWVRSRDTHGKSLFGAEFYEPDIDPMDEDLDTLKAAAVTVVRADLTAAASGETRAIASEAAGVLDGTEAAVDELEQLLVEYDGRPLYRGECHYLEEATID